MGVVLLVRHGQASFGADDYDVLSETGWEQSRLLGRYLADRDVRPDVVVHGDMCRHRDTASAMGEAAGWTVEATVDAGWNEFDHLGVVAAYPELPTDRELDRAGFQRVFEQATARWTAGLHDADYPESWGGFVERVGHALDRTCAAAGQGRTAVVVSSGGPIAAACAALVGPDPRDTGALAGLWARFNTVCVNSGVTRLVVGRTGARMLTFNEHPHLEGDHLTYR